MNEGQGPGYQMGGGAWGAQQNQGYGGQGGGMFGRGGGQVNRRRDEESGYVGGNAGGGSNVRFLN